MELEQLIALNDEIAALTRAGVPLGKGLLDVGSDLSRRLSGLTTELGVAINQGKSLEAAIHEHAEIPSLYAAVVAAGMRSGHLTGALERVATSLRRLAELRQTVASALLYPLIVLGLALALFAIFVRHAHGELAFLIADRDYSAGGGWLEWWLHMISEYGGWLFIAPIVIVLLAAGWWWQSGRALMARISRNQLAYALIPGAAKLLRWGQLATFVEVLSLLVTSRVSMPQAVRLAAAAADGTELRRDADALAALMEEGRVVDWQGTPGAGIPRMVGWMLQGTMAGDDLSPALHELSDRYLTRAQMHGDWLRTALPAAATVLVAGTATFSYAASFIIPWFAVLLRISERI